MRSVYAVFKREFKSYFNLPIAYVYIFLFLVLSNLLFLSNFVLSSSLFSLMPFFAIGQANMRGFFELMPWLFLLFVPAITMRLWAEEKKLGTQEILLTLPVRDYEVVLGKFCASFCFLILMVALTFPLVITVSVLGDPDFGPIIGGYLGILLLGAAYLAIGLFISSLTEDQIIALIISTVVFAFLVIIGTDMFAFAVPGSLIPIFSYLSLKSHFDSIARGVIDSRDLIYYFSVIGFFLYLNVRKLATGKWK